MTHGFADAIKRYGRILREGDLASAYRKAGTSFEGQLQQNFVVLHDLNQARAGPWGGKGGGPTFPQSERKRAREQVEKKGTKDPKGPKVPVKAGGSGGRVTINMNGASLTGMAGMACLGQIDFWANVPLRKIWNFTTVFIWLCVP